MAIVDICTFHNEDELWDIHYNVLEPHVDEFIVVQFDKTFSGKPRQFRVPPGNYPKAKFVFHDESVYGKYREMAEASPNTAGASHWKTEFCQKESIRDAMAHLDDYDIVFVGDVDEIWDSTALHFSKEHKLKLRVYTYYLNNRSSEVFHGTIVALAGYIKTTCLNHLRTMMLPDTDEYNGWHFTSLGGPEALKKKLTDSYTAESYATPEVLNRVDTGYGTQDFLGRPFNYIIDESEWPQYLKDNREKYAHLLR